MVNGVKNMDLDTPSKKSLKNGTLSRKEYHRKYYLENKEKICERTWRNNLLTRYGITPEQRDQMLIDQDYKCGICECCIEGKNAHLDHCHASGKIRKMLCWNCNGGLGNFKDNQELLMKAISYLNE